jgi:predicted nuclease with TOPRIM domain
MVETCPICLDEIKGDDYLCMPVCQHKVHTVCELKAAQYDSRCPVCRTKHPFITSRAEDDVQHYTNMEQLVNDQEAAIVQYNRKRSRIIRNHSNLSRLREKLKKEKKTFFNKEKELEREWIQLQKNCWKTDATINKLKNERKRHQRKTNILCKKLEGEIETIMGPKPEDLFNLINIHF